MMDPVQGSHQRVNSRVTNMSQITNNAVTTMHDDSVVMQS